MVYGAIYITATVDGTTSKPFDLKNIKGVYLMVLFVVLFPSRPQIWISTLLASCLRRRRVSWISEPG